MKRFKSILLALTSGVICGVFSFLFGFVIIFAFLLAEETFSSDIHPATDHMDDFVFSSWIALSILVAIYGFVASLLTKDAPNLPDSHPS
jgi:ABC-type antimicrobial peptide transport system permease subunit